MIKSNADTAVFRSIDRAVAALNKRLRAKGDVYYPDAEWAACREAVAALENAKATLERCLATGEKGRM
jgi:glycine/D-amino acid oxidase-like deaminating enzyme